MSQDNPNFWETHIAAMGMGILVGAGITSYAALDSKKQEDQIVSLRNDLDACLTDKAAITEELDGIKERRKQDYDVVKRLRDENRKMNMWMEWLAGQEKKLMEEKKKVAACIDEGHQLDPLASFPDGFELSEEGQEEVAELMRQGCKVGSVLNGRVHFTQKVNCRFSSVGLKSDPGKDHYNRESFGKELSEYEEELVSLLEERKHTDVVNKISTEKLREELDLAMGMISTPSEVKTAFEELIDKTEQYQNGPGNYEAKCAILAAFAKLADLSASMPDPHIFFDGKVSLSMFLEAVEGGGMGIGDNFERCFDILGIKK